MPETTNYPYLRYQLVINDLVSKDIMCDDDFN